MTLEFVSYDGKYPTLCDGRLILKDADTGTFYRLDDVLMCDAYASSPAGATKSCTGPWKVYEDALPKDLIPYINEITSIANEYVEHGHCGGCV